MSDLSTGFDPSNRDLCPDGACIGVIGPDGCCKVCGKQGPTGAAQRAQAETGATPGEDKEVEGASDTTTQALKDKDTDLRPDLDIESRELCSDGACIGVIGPDGRCKVCGKSA